MNGAAGSRAARISTAYLLTCAAIGVAASVVLAPAWIASTTLFVTVPFASVSVAGLWVLPAVIGLRLLQRPGAGMLVGLISGLVLAPFFTIGSLATMVYWSFFPELPFLATLYRRWNTALHYLGAVAAGATYPLFAGQAFDLWSMTPPVLIGFIALCAGSCVAATWLGILVADRLRAAGVATLARRRSPAAS